MSLLGYCDFGCHAAFRVTRFFSESTWNIGTVVRIYPPALQQYKQDVSSRSRRPSPLPLSFSCTDRDGAKCSSSTLRPRLFGIIGNTERPSLDASKANQPHPAGRCRKSCLCLEGGVSGRRLGARRGSKVNFTLHPDISFEH